MLSYSGAPDRNVNGAGEATEKSRCTGKYEFRRRPVYNNVSEKKCLLSQIPCLPESR